MQGSYFPISTVLPAVNSTLRITGHGTDTTKTRNGVQQTHTGPYKSYTSSGGVNRIRYRVDTMGGNSGSAVVKTVGSTQYAIGVHTHGGCSTSSSSTNAGTYTGRSTYVSGRSAILNMVLPDLDITAVGTSDSTLYPGQKFTASMIVKNIGKVSVPETSTASFYMSTNSTISTGDSLLGNVTVTTLGVNASQTRTLSVKVPTSYTSYAGTRYLGAYADRTGNVVELSESNNTAYRCGHDPDGGAGPHADRAAGQRDDALPEHQDDDAEPHQQHRLRDVQVLPVDLLLLDQLDDLDVGHGALHLHDDRARRERQQALHLHGDGSEHAAERDLLPRRLRRP